MESQSIIYQVSKTDLERLLDEAFSKATETLKAQSKEIVSHDPEKLWNDRQVQKRLGLSRIVLYNYRKSGKLKAVRIGNMIRYREADIREFLRLYNPRLHPENHS